MKLNSFSLSFFGQLRLVKIMGWPSGPVHTLRSTEKQTKKRKTMCGRQTRPSDDTCTRGVLAGQFCRFAYCQICRAHDKNKIIVTDTFTTFTSYLGHLISVSPPPRRTCLLHLLRPDFMILFNNEPVTMTAISVYRMHSESSAKVMG